MVNVLDLPPELVRLTFFESFDNDGKMMDRRRYFKQSYRLRIYSLVHPQWRRIAQQLLVGHIWIETDEDSSIRKSVAVGPTRPPFKSYKVERLTMRDDFGTFVAKFLRWSPTWKARFKNVSVLETRSASDEDLALFRNLQVLTLNDAVFEVVEDSARLFFPKLRRFTFDGRSRFIRGETSFPSVLTPENFPKLVHFAYNAQSAISWPGVQLFPIDLFESLLDQFETVAISDITDSCSMSRVIGELGRRPNLRHLSLGSSYGYTLEKLPRDSNESEFDLESLHISYTLLKGVFESDLFRLLRSRGSEDQTIRTERLVVYGDARDELLAGVLEANDAIQWRPSIRGPPFGDFDGR